MQRTQEKEKCIEAMDFMKDWDTWRKTLKDSIEEGRKYGMSDDTIKRLSVAVGDYLALKVCPATKEEELLRDLWSVATQDERKVLATLIFKMVD
ncbi:MAG: DUF3243 domain-containing protein [Dehalococcoidia bacterium]|nr:DUF3243 domain-containing protein [Dehalococcoidia bacterium]